MVLLTCERVSKHFPEREVLTDVTFGVHAGDRIAVIGANGSGKSTLLGILAGRVTPDSGQVVTNAGLRIAFLEQQPKLDPSSTIADVAGGRRATTALLDRLGFEDPNLPIGALSGGQRRRVAIAAVLAAPADLLILDEPTNHLDVDFIDWLEERLIARPGALIIVTHDRYLLDRVSNRIIEIETPRIHEHRSTYEAFLETRATRQAQDEAVARKVRNEALRELAWLQRSPKARTGKNKLRVERAQLLQQDATDPDRPSLDLALPVPRLGGKVINLFGVGKRFDDWVVRRFTHKLDSRSRIGLVGPNGSGKTTLLRLMAGEVAPDEGKVVHGDTVSIGWYGQDPTPLPPSQRLLDAVADVAQLVRVDNKTTIGAGRLLERFGFPTRQHGTSVGELSGGERRRLELVRVLASAPNVLLLDEPTNDLDLDTLRTLEDLLDTWPGAVVAASHDRFFVDRVCDHVFSIEPGGTVTHQPRGWAGYRESRPSSPAAERPTAVRAAKPKTDRRGLGFKEQREFEMLSERIVELEEQIAAVEELLRRGDGSWEESAEASERLARSLSELAQAEARWLELADRADG